jgi:hypothetical protein
MALYRKLPVVIEAIQLDWATINEVIDLLGDEFTDYYTVLDYDEDGDAREMLAMNITTLEGDMLASHGDYIVKGTHGEFYPVRCDIFEANYEEVD